MNIFGILALVAIVLFVGWRIFLRTQGVWIDVPSDPHEYVKPELVPLVDWLAGQRDAESIEISIPELIGDAEGMHGFLVTLDRAQVEQSGIRSTDA